MPFVILSYHIKTKHIAYCHLIQTNRGLKCFGLKNSININQQCSTTQCLEQNKLRSTNKNMAAAASTYIASIKLPTFSWNIASKKPPQKRLTFRITAKQQAEVQESEQVKTEIEREEQESMKQEEQKTLRPVEPQTNVKSRNLAREYGGQWLSSVTRHVRIYAAYIDPETCAMDQTQMDKLTLILDPTDEFLWTDDTCNKVYAYFQELVDHYEGADLTEYTLRLIGSDIEHYIRKMLYDGELKYNMNARVLNFSMGKPRMKFNSNELPDVQ